MTENIQKWLKAFRHNWKDRDVDSVLDLFADDVEYYETPTQKLENKKEIREEWQSIRNQRDVELDLEVWSGEGNRYTVRWHLEYTEDSERKVLNGIYLIELNDKGKSTEFWQYCQD